MTSMRPFELAGIPVDDEKLRAQVRAFLAERLAHVPPHVRARSWMGFDAAFSRALADKGWLGLTLPRAYGGAERGAFARFVIAEELLAAGAPVAAHWFADRQSGPLILKYGTEAQSQFYLPRICAGEAFFCIGMSEPNSGSDLASIRTRAEKTPVGWRLQGQKIWTSNANHCHYMIALVRTSGRAEDRHRGLSQFIVDLKTPGITVRPIKDLAGDAHFSEVFFDNVELHNDALIGEEGAGWEQVTAELAFERSGPERLYSSLVLADTWLAWLRSRKNPTTAEVTLAGALIARLSALRAMSIAVTNKLECGESPVVEAALVKDLGTEFEQQLPVAIAGLLGAELDGEPCQQLSSTLLYTSMIAPAFSLRGGTREILRGMIARGLGLR